MDETKEPTWKEILLSGLRSIPFRSRKFIWALVAVVVALAALAAPRLLVVAALAAVRLGLRADVALAFAFDFGGTI